MTSRTEIFEIERRWSEGKGLRLRSAQARRNVRTANLSKGGTTLRKRIRRYVTSWSTAGTCHAGMSARMSFAANTTEFCWNFPIRPIRSPTVASTADIPRRSSERGELMKKKPRRLAGFARNPFPSPSSPSPPPPLLAPTTSQRGEKSYPDSRENRSIRLSFLFFSFFFFLSTLKIRFHAV